MPKMKIVRNKHVDAPISKVYSVLQDMSSWSKWSPWLITEPEAKVDVAADNRSYSWDGNRVGAGNMNISSEEDNKVIHYDLNFLKPWKSRAKVKFEVKEKDGGTDVTWHMDSSLPWFMFWMKKKMEAFVGNDYERGLNLLKDYIEDEGIHSKINWLGESQFPGCDYVGITRKCTIETMPDLMKKDYNDLRDYTKDLDGADFTKAFAMYHKFDFVKRTVSYTAGVPTKNMPADLPDKYFAGNIPSTKIYTVEHVGPYEHLGNAWSAIAMMTQNKEIKASRKIHPFETYGNSPMNTDPKDLITHINYPLK